MAAECRRYEGKDSSLRSDDTGAECRILRAAGCRPYGGRSNHPPSADGTLFSKEGRGGAWGRNAAFCGRQVAAPTGDGQITRRLRTAPSFLKRAGVERGGRMSHFRAAGCRPYGGR